MIKDCINDYFNAFLNKDNIKPLIMCGKEFCHHIKYPIYVPARNKHKKKVIYEVYSS